MKKIAVLTFPGMNCEVETVRALRRSGFDSNVVLWNEDPKVLKSYDGIVFPGGFSFEDRGRSGVVSAKEPIIEAVKEMSKSGKPVLGICNGAQVLVEAGLIPGFTENTIEMGLARNKRISIEGEVLGVGFYHSWVYLKNTAPKGRSAFSNFDDGILLRMPVAHGEGRFQASPEVLEAVMNNNQNVFSYCDENGDVIDSFPINPNGSANSIAGVCNPEGNVLAMMPHPERTDTCDVIFESMNSWFDNQKVHSIKKEELRIKNSECQGVEIDKYQIEFFISLKITDNTEKTIERAMQKVLKNNDLNLERQVYWGVQSEADDLNNLALSLANSGEIFNENKEMAVCRVGDKYFKYQNKKLEPVDFKIDDNTFLAVENEDFIGREKGEKVKHHLRMNIGKIQYGTLWTVKSGKGVSKEDIDKTALFANPVAGTVVKYS